MKIEAESLNMDSEPKQIFSELEHRTIEKTCKESGEKFTLNQTRYGEVWFPDFEYCDKVMERMERDRLKKEQKIKQDRIKELNQIWIQENIPPYYQSKLDRKADLDWVAVDKALNWNNQSMVLKGETRRGKTRALYEIAKRNAGIKPVIHTAERLARILGSCLSQSAHAHEKEIKQMCRHRLLCIDDLGKESVTHRTQADLFEIINRRLEHNKPTIITTNFDSEGLARRFTDPDLAIPLIARIGEYKVIQFK